MSSVEFKKKTLFLYAKFEKQTFTVFAIHLKHLQAQMMQKERKTWKNMKNIPNVNNMWMYQNIFFIQKTNSLWKAHKTQMENRQRSSSQRFSENCL